VGGKLGEARSRFRAALKAKPGYAKAYRGLGLVYERSGDKSKAVRAFRTYLRLSPRARDKASINKRITAMGG
jgi:Flp pilus assembly protein TadD